MPKLTNMDRPDYFFLIGGADLEMLTIRQLLTTNGFAEGKNMADRQLQWGAKLSAYKTFFNNKQTFVGIELTQDINPPPHYINIDHHNENSNKSTSLEQVIELLKNDFGIEVEFTRELQLIAANDRGYIPGMIDMGATPEEIANIRQRDKDAQGVTKEDERLGERSIIEHRTTEKGITIVKSLTTRFATITDRLFPYSELLIYNEHELTCYGKGVKKLSELSVQLSNNWKVYFGGGENGYWGISGGKIDRKLIKQIINIFAMQLFSSHVFLFPFKWKLQIELDKSKNQSLDIDIFSYLLGNKWKSIDYEADKKVLHYNQLKYFHQFVHPAIFENKKKPKDTLVKQFEYTEAKGWEYKIKINQRERLPENESLFRDEIPKPPDNYKYFSNDFTLTIVKITLELFTQGVGIFSFHLKNTKYDKPEDILLINQFGRRIYPPFLDKHSKDFGFGELSYLEGTQYRELPVKIIIADQSNKLVEENFSYYENLYDPNFKYLPGHIAYFFQKEKGANIYDYSLSGEEIKLLEGKLVIKSILDDRMFVICWYGAEQLTYNYRAKKLTPKKERKEQVYVLSDLCQRTRGGYEVSGFYRNDLQHRSLALNQTHDSFGYSSNDFWYQFVFVDGFSPSCANSKLRTEQIEKHTYSRWVENNTLYGVTRYSFVCVTEPIEKLGKPFPNAGFIVDHIQTIYFRMVTLVLAQRAMVLNFSGRINKIRDDFENEKVGNKALIAYKDYRKFINKFFYREVTAQEQGIELYDMLQEHLRVEKQAKELEKEFEEMHRLIDLVGANQSSARMKIFAILTGVFLIPTFILNLLKNRNFDDLKPLEKFLSGEPVWQSVYLLLFLTGFAFFITNALLSWTDKVNIKLIPKRLNNFFVSYRIFRWNIKRRMIFLLISSVLLIFYLISFQLSVSRSWVGIFTVFLVVLIILTLLTSKTKK